MTGDNVALCSADGWYNGWGSPAWLLDGESGTPSIASECHSAGAAEPAGTSDDWRPPMEHLSAHKLMSEPGARISLEDYEVVHVCYDGRADDRRPDVTVGFRHSSTRAITYLRFTSVLFDDYHGMSAFFTLGDSHIMNTDDRQWEARAKIEVSGYRVNHWWAESVENVDAIA